MEEHTERYSRRHLRSPPDPTDFAQIDLDADPGKFTFQYVGLIKEEAPMGGCSIVCLESVGLSQGKKLRIKVGRMSPVMAEIVWNRKIDEGVYSYGVKFLE